MWVLVSFSQQDCFVPFPCFANMYRSVMKLYQQKNTEKLFGTVKNEENPTMVITGWIYHVYEERQKSKCLGNAS